MKQVCSLSSLLHILCLEPFVRKVCKDKDIEGLKLPSSPEQCKISVLDIVNIEYKLYALRLKNIQEIILNGNTKFVNFSIYWILRDFNLSLASLSVPHWDLVSPFYNKCLKVLNIFKDKCNDVVLGQYNTKTLYNLLLDNDIHVIKIVKRNVDMIILLYLKMFLINL